MAAQKKAHVNSMFSSQEGLEFPAHSHHQRPDLVAPRGLLLLPRHQEGGVGCESLRVGKSPLNGGLELGKSSINRGLNGKSP